MLDLPEPQIQLQTGADEQTAQASAQASVTAVC